LKTGCRTYDNSRLYVTAAAASQVRTACCKRAVLT